MDQDRRPSSRVGVRRADGEEFAERLATAIAENDVTLSRLTRRLATEGHAVSVATLSYWRSGQRRPEGVASIEAVACLEDLLGLGPGHLLSAVPPARRRGPPLPRRLLVDLTDAHGGDHERLEEFGLDSMPDRLRTTSIHVALDVDAARNDYQATTRLTLCAVVDDVSHVPIALSGLEGLPPGDRPHLTQVRGATVDDSVHLAELGIQAWNLRLERQLRVGETAVVEHVLGLPEERHDHFEYLVEQRVRELLLWIRFDPTCLPTSAELYDTASGEEVVTPLDLGGLTSVTVLLPSYGPGRVGVRWTW